MSNEFVANNYLTMGRGGIPTVMNPALTRDMLDGLGYGTNAYTQTRLGTPFDMLRSSGDNQHCNFCLKPLIGVEYDRLADGRARCSTCSRTTIASLKEFQALFETAKMDMQRFYGVSIQSRIKVSMVSPRKMERVCGEGGVLGLAVKRANSRDLLMVNGAPLVPALGTMMHELTHIWQYENWDDGAMSGRYSSVVPLHPDPTTASAIVHEGMAVWAQVQYLLLLGQTEYAQRLTAARLQETSVYGVGLALFFKRYGFSTDAFLAGKTPFDAGIEPLG